MVARLLQSYFLRDKVGRPVSLLWRAAYERAFAHAIGPRGGARHGGLGGSVPSRREVHTSSLAARAYRRCSVVPGRWAWACSARHGQMVVCAQCLQFDFDDGSSH
jgi:hypothetical protein